MVDRDDEATPFAATPGGVERLLDTPLLDVAPDPGRYGVHVAQVGAWLGEISGRVALRLDRWQQLSDVAVEPELTSDRDQLVAAARDLVQHAGASYAEARRHPERAGAGGYAQVLWDRYTTGLADLEAWLARRLAAPGGGDGVDAGAAAGGASGGFPAPAFPDRWAW